MRSLKLITVLFCIATILSCKEDDIELPLEEELIDRVNYKVTKQPYDSPFGYGNDYYFMYDGSLRTYFHVLLAFPLQLSEYENWSYNGINIPVNMVTVDLGKMSQLTRFKFWQTKEFSYYRHSNSKIFDLWGTNELNDDGTLDGWTLMLENAEVIKPSGTLTYEENTEEDIAAAEAGHEFLIPDDMPKVRYIRFVQKLAWNNINAWLGISEIEFYRYKEE